MGARDAAAAGVIHAIRTFCGLVIVIAMAALVVGLCVAILTPIVEGFLR